MNLVEVIPFNAKKDLYELNIEVNDLAPVNRFLRGDGQVKVSEL
jgi:hypothetical protein